MSRREVLAFFRRYRDAFDRLDGEAVAALWHVPSTIAGNTDDGHVRVTSWPNVAPMRDNMRSLCDGYRSAGYSHARFELLDHVPLGRHHSFVNLRWTISHRDGSTLPSFRTGYQLVRTGAGVRVVMATAYEEDLARTTRTRPHAAQ